MSIPSGGVTVVLTVRLNSYSVAEVAEKEVPEMIRLIEGKNVLPDNGRRPIVVGANVKRSPR